MNKFAEWVGAELDDPNNNDLQPHEAAEMGWDACKNEILKILLQENIYDPDSNCIVRDFLEEEINKL